jgi:hypothetical protein
LNLSKNGESWTSSSFHPHFLSSELSDFGHKIIRLNFAGQSCTMGNYGDTRLHLERIKSESSRNAGAGSVRTNYLSEIESVCRSIAADHGMEIRILQSNHEGESIDWIHEARSEGAGIVINPAAFATPKDLWELNQQLGRPMRGRTYFFLQTTLDYKTTVETQPPHKTESGKRFWIKGQDG